jgi:uncharacterized membrane protein YfcA
MSDDWELAMLVIPFSAIMVIFAGIIVSAVYYPGSDIRWLTYLLYGAMAVFVIGYMYSRLRLNKRLRAERHERYEQLEKVNTIKTKGNHEEE